MKYARTYFEYIYKYNIKISNKIFFDYKENDLAI